MLYTWGIECDFQNASISTTPTFLEVTCYCDGTHVFVRAVTVIRQLRSVVLPARQP